MKLKQFIEVIEGTDFEKAREMIAKYPDGIVTYLKFKADLMRKELLSIEKLILLTAGTIDKLKTKKKNEQ